jgi:hypothetical protein
MVVVAGLAVARIKSNMNLVVVVKMILDTAVKDVKRVIAHELDDAAEEVAEDTDSVEGKMKKAVVDRRAN